MAEAFFLNSRGQTIDVLIPVPTHHKKKFVRGYNQSEKIAQGISKHTNIPIDNSFIFKRKQTESQTKKTKAERWSNVSGGFRQGGQNENKYKHIAIVDDVITTGATLEALIKEIKQVYPMIEISIFALAMAK
jgi:ComF family protein